MAKLYMLSSTTDTIHTAFVLQSGKTVIAVDGGFPHEAEHLHRVLRRLGGRVDAWFLTHAHDDHILPPAVQEVFQAPGFPIGSVPVKKQIMSVEKVHHRIACICPVVIIGQIDMQGSVPALGGICEIALDDHIAAPSAVRATRRAALANSGIGACQIFLRQVRMRWITSAVTASLAGLPNFLGS